MNNWKKNGRVNITFSKVKFNNGASIFMTASPKDKLEVKFLLEKARINDITTIVVLLESKSLLPMYREQGFNVIHYPIKDYSVPKNFGSFNKLIEQILTLLKDNQNVLIHCHAGHGRTGMVVIGSLIRLGKHPDDAYDYINKIRSVIDTDEQFDFLNDYYDYLQGLRRENGIDRSTDNTT